MRSGFTMLAIAWLVGPGWLALVVAVRATHLQMDPFVLYLLAPIWLLCFVLVAVGTYRIASLIRNRVVRAMVTFAAIAVQCLLYWLSMFPITVYAHLRAGGNL